MVLASAIFLGLPLGPHLLTRDDDAIHWLAAAVRQAIAGA
jgi:hypothetical protein